MNLFWKRIYAYSIDILIIVFLGSLLNQTPLNPLKEKYDNDYNEYNQKIESMNIDKITLDDYYKDGIFDENEIKKIKEIDSTEYDYVNEKHEDIRNKIMLNINKNMLSIENHYNYIMDKNSMYSNLIISVLIISYFGVVQYFSDCQSIGKKIFKLQIISTKNKCTLKTLILRSFILYKVWLILLSIILVNLLSEEIYIYWNIPVVLISIIFEVIIIYTIIKNEKNCGIHDLITSTCVTILNEKEN